MQHATGMRDMDRLGGLLKRMPVTGTTFLDRRVRHLRAAAAERVCQRVFDLPGRACRSDGRRAARRASAGCLCVLVIGGLALIGGLAAACSPRPLEACSSASRAPTRPRRGHEGGWAMRAAMVILAAACVLAALTAPVWPLVLRPAVHRSPRFFFSG